MIKATLKCLLQKSFMLATSIVIVLMADSIALAECPTQIETRDTCNGCVKDIRPILSMIPTEILQSEYQSFLQCIKTVRYCEFPLRTTKEKYQSRSSRQLSSLVMWSHPDTTYMNNAKALETIACHAKAGWPLSPNFVKIDKELEVPPDKPRQTNAASEPTKLLEEAKSKGYGALLDLAQRQGCFSSSRPTNGECEKISGATAREVWYSFKCNVDATQKICQNAQQLNEVAGSEKAFLPSPEYMKSSGDPRLLESAGAMTKLANGPSQGASNTSTPSSQSQQKSALPKCSAVDAYGKPCISIVGYDSVQHSTFGPTYYKVKFKMSESCTGTWLVRATTSAGVKLETGIRGGGESELSCSSQGKNACTGISSTGTFCN